MVIANVWMSKGPQTPVSKEVATGTNRGGWVRERGVVSDADCVDWNGSKKA